MHRTLIMLSLFAISLGAASAALVTGKIVDTDGKPINGASIHLALYDGGKSLELLSDAAGNYSVELDTAHHSPGMRLASMVVYAPGYELTGASLEQSGDVVTLDTATTLSGTVSDTEGKPLAGVPIRLLRQQNVRNFILDEHIAEVPEEWYTRFTAISAADGSWTLPGILKTGQVWLAPDGDRYRHEEQRVTLLAGQPATVVRIIAHPGAVLTGRILTPEGTPAVGVRIVAYNYSAAGTSGYGKTATDGSYRIAGLAADIYTIYVDKSNIDREKQTWIAEPLEGIALSEGKETTAPDLRTHPGAVATGRILTPEGTPATDAQVRFSAQNIRNRSASFGMGRTAADGSYRIGGLATGSYTLNASSDIDLWCSEQVTDIALTEGKETVVPDLHTHTGAGLEGTVVDAETGRPVAGRTFIRLYAGNTLTRESLKANCWTEQNGHFFLRVEPGQLSLSIARVPYGYLEPKAAETIPVDLREGKTLTVTLKLHKGLPMTGTLYDGDGKPLAGMYSLLFNPSTQSRDANWYSRWVNISADGQGHFEVAGLPAGKGTFDRINDLSPEWELPEPVAVELPAKAPIIIRLRRIALYNVTGTVSDDAGKPAAGVHFFYSGQRSNAFATDARGHFEITGVPAGRGWLELSDTEQPAYPNESIAFNRLYVEVPLKEPLILSITHKAIRAVSGRVVDSAHQPLAGVEITFFLPDQYGDKRHPTAHTGADGRYQSPPGTQVFLLGLYKAGYRQRITGTLCNNGTDAIDDAVMVPCTATVHGKVLDAGGKPLPGATVVSAEGGLDMRAVTDTAGAFTLVNQPEGDLHLVAATPAGGGLATCPENTKDVLITCTPGTVAKPIDIPLAMQLLDADSKLPEAQRHFDRGQIMNMMSDGLRDYLHGKQTAEGQALAVHLLETDGKLPREQRLFDRTEIIRELADVNFALALRLTMNGDEPVSDDLRAYLLGKQAEQQPEKVDDIVVQLNLLKASDSKLYAAVAMGMAAAKTEPELAEQLYQIAKQSYDRWAHGSDDVESLSRLDDLAQFLRASLPGFVQKSTNLDVLLDQTSGWAKQQEAESVPRLEDFERIAPMIAFAGVLHRSADLDAMLARLKLLLKSPRSFAIPAPLFAAASRVSPEFVIKVYHAIESSDNRQISWAVQGAVTSMAQHNPAAARRLIQMLLEAKIIDIASGNADDFAILGKIDPPAALALAKSATQSYQQPWMLLTAASYQPKTTADAIISGVFAEEQNRTLWNLAKVNTIDPEMAKTLYQQYKTTMTAAAYRQCCNYCLDDAQTHERYAYLISSIDPLEARLLLETEYSTALIKAQHGGRLNDLSAFPATMCTLDVKRALEMADSINDNSVNVQYDIMRYILTSREDRVNRW